MDKLLLLVILSLHATVIESDGDDSEFEDANSSFEKGSGTETTSTPKTDTTTTPKTDTPQEQKKPDDDNKDIDDFDFGLNELDKEKINIQANTIPPSAWLVICDNVHNLVKKYKQNQKEREQLENDIKRLKELEDVLFKRNQLEYDENKEPKQAVESNALELLVLNTIKTMKPEDQSAALDIDNDGIADFSF